VVWIFRKTQWIALFTTDLSLSVEQIVEYYGARWKIEAGFKELKRSSQFSVSVPKPSGGGQPPQLFYDGRSGHLDLCHAT
jgi:hypothetical protein